VTFLVAAVALFGAGLTATLSPCVLPLVPGYVGVLLDGAAARRAVGARVALFAAGAAAAFAALGAGAGLAGSATASIGVAVQRVAGAALLVMAVLSWLRGRGWAWRRRGARFAPAGVAVASPAGRALWLGLACGVAWAPCTGPLLGAALTAAAGASSTIRSTVLLLAYASGVLSPFVAIALVRPQRVPRRVRQWGRGAAAAGTPVMAVLGLVLLLGWYEQLVSRLGLLAR
jgi:cytochrome c-type biogenesis protein